MLTKKQALLLIEEFEIENPQNDSEGNDLLREQNRESFDAHEALWNFAHGIIETDDSGRDEE